MSQQRGLGRGFDALIPTAVTANLPEVVKPTKQTALQTIELGLIKPNPHQPRQQFDEAELAGLAASIKHYGIMHPPVVSRAGEAYELIAGERRVRAAKLAGLKAIEVIVRSYDEQQKLEMALLENVQRANLGPLETALAYRKLTDEFNLSLDQIGASMGQARSTVSNTMRLLQLPAEAQTALTRGKINEAHGRAILALQDPNQQRVLLQSISANNWTVRQAEDYVRQAKQGNAVGVQTGRQQFSPNPAAAALTKEISVYLGAKVKLQPKAKGGRLVIEYQSEDELTAIVRKIKP